MPLPTETYQLIGLVLAPSGVVAATIKLVLNGSKQRIIDIGDDVKDVKRAVTRLHTRVDAVELNQALEEGKRMGRAELIKELNVKP
jgi:hypothetical protein